MNEHMQGVLSVKIYKIPAILIPSFKYSILFFYFYFARQQTANNVKVDHLNCS